MIFKRLLIVLLLFAAVLFSGIAAYMSVITLSTVGYKEIAELSVAGKLFTIGLIIGGILAVTVGIAMFTRLVLEGDPGEYLRRKKMDKSIEALKNHIIICGLGELGEEVIRNLSETNEDYIVIDNSEAELARLKKFVGDFPAIKEDARQSVVLESANISTARTLITCLGSDSQNLFVVITARELNPGLTIVTEAIERNVREKFRRAGADYIISPSQIGGMRMARVATKPAVVSFLDVITGGPGGRELHLESVEIKETSDIASMSLAEAKIPLKTGLIILSVKKNKLGQFIYNPSSQTVHEPGDEIIVIGPPENLDKLKKFTG